MTIGGRARARVGGVCQSDGNRGDLGVVVVVELREIQFQIGHRADRRASGGG